MVIPEVPGGSDVISRSDSFIEEPPPITSTTLCFLLVMMVTLRGLHFFFNAGNIQTVVVTALLLA